MSVLDKLLDAVKLNDDYDEDDYLDDDLLDGDDDDFLDEDREDKPVKKFFQKFSKKSEEDDYDDFDDEPETPVRIQIHLCSEDNFQAGQACTYFFKNHTYEKQPQRFTGN